MSGENRGGERFSEERYGELSARPARTNKLICHPKQCLNALTIEYAKRTAPFDHRSAQVYSRQDSRTRRIERQWKVGNLDRGEWLTTKSPGCGIATNIHANARTGWDPLLRHTT